MNYTPLKIDNKSIKKPVGRPTIFTDDTLHKLRTAFLMGCSDREACAYAEISNGAFYNYQEAHPEYVEQKEYWKQHPILMAKHIIVKSLENKDKDMAKWYLERKLKDEFSPRQEHTGENGDPIQLVVHSSLTYERQEGKIIEADIKEETGDQSGELL